jgi:hypothetical protein
MFREPDLLETSVLAFTITAAVVTIAVWFFAVV